MGKNKETLFVIFLLFLATFGIAATNYHPGTSLTGWDDLHSEFNLIGNILRSINFVWQDYEAMGTFIGVNDGADLPRLIYLWFLSLALPVSLIRYTFHFSMLLIGSVGTYFVIKTFFIDKHEKIKDFAALSGALFYLLNLGTLQYFATPFEPFSTFWGFFPWLIFGVFNYLYNPKRSNLFIFAFLNILAMPLFFLQTIFYVYLLILLFIFGTYFITHKTKIVFKTIVVAFSIFISVNAFWLLPHIYWFASSHSVQQEASMNRLTTEDTYQKVQQFGDLSSFMLFKNKPWDYRDFINSDQIFLLQSWHNYFENPYIPAIGYLIFIISILGIITLKSNRIFVIGLTVISFLILANQVPIAREFNLLFRQIGIVNQVLRDPFTKFIVPTIFVFAVGFSAGIILLYKLIPSKIIKPVSYIGGVIVIMMLVVYAWPIYTGHFFADRMRVTTPQYYFDFFNFMRQQDPSKRIANLPQGPVWGWTNYSWGYTGSGFLWHGFNQSILDRTFDVWNDKNEEYYWELTYALNKRDYELFNSVLNKYQISYVCLIHQSIFLINQVLRLLLLDKKSLLIKILL